MHLGRGLAGVAALTFSTLAAWHQEARWLSATAVCVLIWLIFALLHAFEGARARCAICTGHLFTGTRNVKHPTARHLFGSYQLWTALQVICTVGYRCHHCGAKISYPQPSPEHRETEPHTSSCRRAVLPSSQRQAGLEVVLHTRIGKLKGKKRR